MLMLVAAYAFFAWLRKNYSVSVVFITIFVIAAFNLLAGKGIALMGPRIVDTIIGSILAIAVVRLLWPDWQYKKLPNLLSTALHNNNAYFKAVLKVYQESTIDDLDYRIARYRAHQADSSLALAWQGMKLEPKKQQKFQKHAFSLTYLNHALLSYLSALGAHRESKKYMTEEQYEMFKKVQQELSKAAIALQDKKACRVPLGMKNFLEELGHKLSEMERGSERQKLVLLYNITEVTEQLFQEATQLLNE